MTDPLRAPAPAGVSLRPATFDHDTFKDDDATELPPRVGRRRRCPQCLSAISPGNPARTGGGSCDWCEGVGDYEG
jgi:hypothetical protein